VAHVGAKQKILAGSIALTILFSYLTIVKFANGDPSVATKIFSEIENNPSESYDGQWERDTTGETNLFTWFQLVQFDASEGVATLRIYPFPGETWGDAKWSSFSTERTFTLSIDSAGSNPLGQDSGNCWKFDADYIYGVCNYLIDKATTDRTRDLTFYPFDKYLVPISAAAEIGESKTYDEEKNWEPLAIRPIEYTERVGDFQASWELVDEDGNAFTTAESALNVLDKGEIYLDISLTRSVSTIFIVVILMIFNLVAAAMLGVMAWSVYVGHRPPALGSLVWGAATIFTMLQSRQDVFPSNPPIGVGMDLWFFFPALFVSLLSTSALFVLWIRRSDWIA
jgi:hypothetical protein